MRFFVARSVIVTLVAMLAVSCVGSKDKSEKKQEALKSHVLDKAPADVGKKLNINYDGKVTLLGAKVEPTGKLKPGQRVKLTMYWKVDKEIDKKGWKLFTHVLDGSGERILNIDNVGPLRSFHNGDQALPPSDWKKGKVYVDEQHFTLPKKIKTSTVQVTVGIWKGDDRLKIVSGPGDRQNRGIVANLNVAAKKRRSSRRTRVPELRVDKLEKGQSIKIDGKLDEAAWKTAAKTGPFVDVRTGRQNKKFPVKGSAKLLWDDSALYVAFEVQDPDVVGGFDEKKKDPHLWTKDTVEIMVDPDGDGDNKDYYEVQINPQNLVFDSRFDTYNQPKKGPEGPFGHEDWTAKLESAVSVDGTLDKSTDKDKGYVVEAKIPWKSFDKAKQTPPELGQTWRMNFYAMQNNSGVAWSPILGQGNFHRASRFGKVTWAEKGWTPPKKDKEDTKAKGKGDKETTAKTTVDKAAQSGAKEKPKAPGSAQKGALATAKPAKPKPAAQPAAAKPKATAKPVAAKPTPPPSASP